MIYVVVPTDNEETLQRGIKEFGDQCYDGLAPKVYLVDFNGTARSLSDKLGFNKEDRVVGLVIGLASYDGWADPDVWEWIRNRMPK